jgi:uncharacterized protein (TIGR01777 family)
MKQAPGMPPQDTMVRQCRLPVPAQEAFDWHARPGAFERLTPPWERVELLRHDGVADGARAEFTVRIGPLSRRWIAEHRDVVPGESFRDVQLSGPFAQWEHTHTIRPEDDGTSVLEDRIGYSVPLGAVGRRLGGAAVRRMLERAFAYRHRVTTDDLSALHRYRGTPAMNVLVTGSSGLIGSALVPLLTTGGHQVVRLVRHAPRSGDERAWDPQATSLDPGLFEGVAAVVHLSGESIGDGRWTTARKQRIRDSRVNSTRLIAKTLAEMSQPPRTLVCASAIGIYGDRGDEVLTEESPPGTGFLADVCREWEAAADPARQKGVRVVHIRSGVVLSPRGGALAKMLLPFKLGAGGVVGSGAQYWSWITIDDAAGVFLHALCDERVAGPVNATAPHPVTNREFTRILGSVLHRPTIFPMPAFAARLALGEMADELLLGSACVLPGQLERTGYVFRHAELEAGLRHVLGRTA